MTVHNVVGRVRGLALGDGQIATGQLAKRAKAQGWVAFEMPAGAMPAALKYQVTVLSDRFAQVALQQ